MTVFDEGDNDARPFFEAIGGEGGAIAHPVTEVTSTQQFEKVLLRLSDSSGKMIFSVESRGVLSKDMLDSSDVFILNAGYSIWVWVGKETTSGEKSGAMKVALHYIDENKISPEVPITRIIDGGENAEFLSLLC